jgi:hypothetical protein
MLSILYLNTFFYYVSKIPMVDDSIPDQLQCTTCLLPMQYQLNIDGKFLWQCFKCGKKYFVSENINDRIEESWSPPR